MDHLVLLRRIERFLMANAMPATRFGREAANDPKLVSDLRKGREPRTKLVARINAFIDQHH